MSASEHSSSRAGVIAAAILAVCCQVARVAAEPPAAPALGPYVSPESLTAAAPSPTVLLLRMVGSLTLVLALVLGAAWLLKLKGSFNGTPTAARLRVLESVSLGPSRALHLVAVGKQVLLLGGGNQVTCLATYDADELGVDPEANHPPFDTFLARLQWPGRERPQLADEED